jgi:4-diphosphocytidyl-2-C-methyl-D-erythritol kinase
LPARRYAVLKPPASIETRAIFASPHLDGRAEADIVEGFAGGGCEGLAKTLRVEVQEGLGTGSFGGNDLQAAAEAESAEVGAALRMLRSRFGNARLTGSGSAVFAVAGGGDGSGGSLADLPAGWTGRMCRSLVAHPLRDWAG